MAEFDDENIILRVADEDARRIDAYLPVLFADVIVSRSQAGKILDEGRVTVSGKVLRSKDSVKKGDEIEINLPEPPITDVLPENIALDIVYEDDDILVINKPRGMVVHPAAGNYTGTVVNALLHRYPNLSKLGGEGRPGIVHRIDKDTTGLLCIAKTDRAHVSLSAQLETHSMHRCYVAVCEGVIKEDSGTIDRPIGRSLRDRKKMAIADNGRHAVTNFTVLERNYDQATTLLSLELETGRTHQIRVHLASINHPVTGDAAYGHKNARGMVGQALHAYALTLTHPTSGKIMTFYADAPSDFVDLCRKMNFEDALSRLLTTGGNQNE